jgi:hypothetical protein
MTILSIDLVDPVVWVFLSGDQLMVWMFDRGINQS